MEHNPFGTNIDNQSPIKHRLQFSFYTVVYFVESLREIKSNTIYASEYVGFFIFDVVNANILINFCRHPISSMWINLQELVSVIALIGVISVTMKRV